MKKINLHNNDITTILTVSLLQSHYLRDINELFNTNVLDDINHSFIYDEVLRYITDTTFNSINNFDDQTLKLFYGKKNCWIIRNKLIELLQSSKDWWAQGGDFKVVLDFEKASQGFINCYIYYENNNITNEEIKKYGQRNLTLLKIELFDNPTHSMIADKKFITNANSTLNILNKMISFSNCLGFYKWIDREKRLTEMVNFNQIEDVINKARDFVKDQKVKRFLNRKEFEEWRSSRLDLLDKTIKAFNDLENNIQNHIDENKEKIKEEVISNAEAEEILKKQENEELKKAK